MKSHHYLVSLLILLAATLSSAQSNSSPRVSTVIAELEKQLESKTATLNQEIVLMTLNDVIVDGKIVIPKGSKLIGQIADPSAKQNDSGKNALAIRIDKAVTPSGAEIPLQAIIAAIKAPTDDSLTSDPQYDMMHSNEPKMTGASTSATTASGSLPASSKANSTAAVATAEIKGGMSNGTPLTAESQGVIGYEGITISWSLTSPPPLTLFVSKSKNIKLKAGTQMLLRMAEPRIPR